METYLQITRKHKMHKRKSVEHGDHVTQSKISNRKRTKFSFSGSTSGTVRTIEPHAKCGKQPRANVCQAPRQAIGVVNLVI